MSRLKTQHASTRRDDFESLYRGTFADVYAYSWTILRNDTAAEEAVAVAFERAYRRWNTFNPKRGTRRLWLFGIVRNATLDELRRIKRYGKLADALKQEPSTSGDENQTEDVVEREAIWQLLSQLSGAERELVALKFYVGLSNGEIANLTETSVSNVGTRLSRTITKLREVVQ